MSLEFKLTLGTTEYECQSTQSSKDYRNHVVSAKINGMRVTIDIPMEAKKKRMEVIAFIERLHEGMKIAAEQQKE